MKRRKFIHNASCAAMGSSTMLSTLLNLKAANAASIANSTVVKDGDYKALVCILLQGGNDSFNMLMPRTGQPYQEYKTTRSNLALKSEDMLPITPKTSNGRDFGLHPSLQNVKRMFDEEKVAFLANVGTLVEPTTPDDFFAETVKLPLGLLSHSDQVQHWQTAFPQDRSALGWGGKISDLIGDMNNNQSISMGISMNGNNTFQAGKNAIAYAVDPVEGPQGIEGYLADDGFGRIRTKAIDDILGQNYADLYEKTYIDVIKNSRDTFLQFNDALKQIPTDGIIYPTDEWQVGESFNMVKNTIAAHNILDLQRQTFFISFEGWDHHDEVLDAQTAQFSALDRALDSFQKSMVAQGLEDSVTTFVISDFARTLTSNGNGTDHAWGGNVFALGGAVKGGDIYGKYPNISLKDDSDLGGGIFVPGISADEYFAELALWFGVPATDLPLIFPNIRNFYNLNSGQYPLGFLT
ncbi:MAG: DUF1501 domain-containing protein [Saprospiraceae bacterium]